MLKILIIALFVPIFAGAITDKVAGIGVALDKYETSFIRVGAILEGSPADSVPQLKVGVVIRSVFTDGQWFDLKDTTMERATKILRGKSGTQLTLRISESDTGPTEDVSVERRNLSLPKTASL